jgi:cytochrome c biogenesis protein CcdA/thiol-disulfide isomerase/thioredoxin
MLLLAFLAGVLTILSPCVLPVLPLVFARTHRGFFTDTLPVLLGLGLVFVVTSVFVVAVGVAVPVASAGRWLGIAFLGLAAVSLIVPAFSASISRPVVALGSALAAYSRLFPRPLGSFVTGCALGFLWAPCAGPVLGLVVVLNAAGPSAYSVSLFGAFAVGAMASMAVALAAATRAWRVLAPLRLAGRAGHPLLGALALVGLVFLAGPVSWRPGWLASARTDGGSEGALVHFLGFRQLPAPSSGVPSLGALSLSDGWLVRPLPGLSGKVVLVEFWTQDCSSCLALLPRVAVAAAPFPPDKVVLVAVHTPQFIYSRSRSRLASTVGSLGIGSTVLLDDEYRIWKSFGADRWPSLFIFDRSGTLRYRLDGEGAAPEMAFRVAGLLAERPGTRAAVQAGSFGHSCALGSDGVPICLAPGLPVPVK